MSSSVFLIGPGFIGGEILDLLLKENYSVTTLVRRESAAADFAKLGVQTVRGTLDDKDVIISQVGQSDIIIHTATADHLPSVEAVLEGIRQRAANALQTIFIHTSGASLLADNSAGAYKSQTVFDDENPAQIDALPDSAPHRKIDLAIVRARNELAAYAKLAIMIPPLIYGISTREKRTSIQLPTIVRYSLKHGYAGQIGAGRSVWNQVHVKDLARGYITLLHWLESRPSSEVVQNPYFFCENGQELSWGECSAEIGRILQKDGRIKDSTPRTIPPENYADIFGDYSEIVEGSNARHRANRLRKLGWAPSEKQTFASLEEDEIPLILTEKEEFKGYSKPVAS
ncbi:NAD(P)-binding protein [Aspergillus uvarum CBS 121591]|uniref:NAD(P)-binding protein n=1 Tax=Aspergillus uvarum CBS 121591 TaxID=1448315 RepID=A0A319DA34_9EURO|nr:NAD(P)-binding protein [Aspergillus uvarum CBS 121591]PYH76802.1 NAD(P)-binding protein [Aspergillus uvarum CBS 121591]